MSAPQSPMIRKNIPMHSRTSTPAHFVVYLSALFLLLFFSAVSSVEAEEHSERARSSISFWSPPLTFFQKVISKADGDRCPMYPSCSHYARQAFKRHGAFKGWILTSDRLLRCGHDETRLSPKVRANGKVRTFDPIEANTRWWRHP
jgi:uncharacterized protein